MNRIPPVELSLQLRPYAQRDRRVADVAARGREFRTRFIDPVARDLDARMLLEPTHVPHEVIARGCAFGLLSLPIPAFAGGGGMTALHSAVLLEELSAGCAGIANIFGAHYLGLSAPLFGLDLHHFDTCFRDVVLAEKRGEPVLFAAAITEPSAGTDVEDEEHLPKAKLSMVASKVPGGYRLNGRKVFISNGGLARYTSVICALDRARPLETWTAFVVPLGTPGFSVGRIERKMGQRACHAAELVFDDCFVSAEARIGIENRAMDITAVVLAASRAPVAAIATGIARGAFERALEVARRPAPAGRICDRAWAQQLLADMATKIVLARACYLQAAAYFDETFVAPLLGRPALVEPLMRVTGPLRRTAVGRRVMASGAVRGGLSARVLRQAGRTSTRAALGWSSLAKFSASDMAVEVCLSALALCGAGGIDEAVGIEKCLRDAKLTQIYEGTNQLNRYATYKGLIREAPPWTI